jgi:hypothetical protein
MLVRVIFLFACMMVTVPSMAQTGHPAKGSWAGFMGPNAADQTRVRLLMDAFNGELSGTINPGRNGIDTTRVTLNAETWTLTVRANMPEGELVLSGKLENLGSWTGRKYFGTYSLGNEMGNFDLILN